MTFQKNIPNMSQGLCQIQDLGHSQNFKNSCEYLAKLENKIQCAHVPAPYMISLYPCTMTQDRKVIKLN